MPKLNCVLTTTEGFNNMLNAKRGEVVIVPSSKELSLYSAQLKMEGMIILFNSLHFMHSACGFLRRFSSRELGHQSRTGTAEDILFYCLACILFVDF